MKSSASVIKELELGFLPNELTFTLEKQQDFDWNCLHYNYWDDFDYWLAKQPTGLIEQFPCLMEWVEQQYESMKGVTPLDEMNERIGLLAKNINDNKCINDK